MINANLGVKPPHLGRGPGTRGDQHERQTTVSITLDRPRTPGTSRDDLDAMAREAVTEHLRSCGYDDGGHRGDTLTAFRTITRTAYREHTEQAYWRAEEACRGELCNRAGEVADIHPRSLFEGPLARARKYASEELLEHWREVGRMTYDDYVADLLRSGADEARAALAAAGEPPEDDDDEFAVGGWDDDRDDDERDGFGGLEDDPHDEPEPEPVRAPSPHISRGGLGVPGPVRLAPVHPVTAPSAPTVGAMLLEETRATLERFAVLPSSYAADALACYAAMCGMRDPSGDFAGETAPRLLLISDEHNTGKSTVGKLMTRIVPNGKICLDTSGWSVVKDIAERQRVLLLDNLDTVLGRGSGARTLLNVLLGGYDKDTAVVGRGKDDNEEMMVFAPIMVTARARKMRVNAELNPGLFGRSVIVEMRRQRDDQECDEFDRTDPRHTALMARLQNALGEWCSEVVDDYRRGMLHVALPEGCTDRHRDVWRPIFRVADLAGGDWPARARAAFSALVLGKVDRTDATPRDALAALSPAQLTMAQVRYVFTETRAAALTTVDLLTYLEMLPGSRWSASEDRLKRNAMGLARDLRLVASSQGTDLDREACKVRADDGRYIQGYHAAEVARICPSDLPTYRLADDRPGPAEDEIPLF